MEMTIWFTGGHFVFILFSYTLCVACFDTAACNRIIARVKGYYDIVNCAQTAGAKTFLFRSDSRVHRGASPQLRIRALE